MAEMITSFNDLMQDVELSKVVKINHEGKELEFVVKRVNTEDFKKLQMEIIGDDTFIEDLKEKYSKGEVTKDELEKKITKYYSDNSENNLRAEYLLIRESLEMDVTEEQLKQMPYDLYEKILKAVQGAFEYNSKKK